MLVGVFGLVFSGFQASASPVVQNMPAGRYIVTFKDSASISKEVSDFRSRKGKVIRTYGRALKGMAVSASTADLRVLQLDPEVASIELDKKVRVSETQSNPVWGLDRIDQKNLPLNNSYNYTATGSGVKVFVVDTGVRATHVELVGRVLTGVNYAEDANFEIDPANTDDCHGHGTHVSGTVAGTTYGVAKQASIVPIRALDCDGSGWDSDIIAGLNWVIGQITPGVSKAVVSMSIGGDYSSALNAAVQDVIDAGVAVVVAAGNEGDDARYYSPASAPNAITVGATDRNDRLSYFSNFGAFVDIQAPGEDITSASADSNSSTDTWSGTSMATPHVSGVIAQLLQAGYKTPSQIRSLLLSNASSGVVRGTSSSRLPLNTVNLLLSQAPSAAISPEAQSYTVIQGASLSTNSLTSSGFSRTPTFAITGTPLPTGLSLNSRTGVISGKPVNAQAATSYTIAATSGSQVASATVQITVTAVGPAVVSVAPATQSVVGSRNRNFTTARLVATGFSRTPTFSITSGSLPRGLSLDRRSGVISGTPRSAQPPTSYVITASSGSQSVSVTISITVN